MLINLNAEEVLNIAPFIGKKCEIYEPLLMGSNTKLFGPSKIGSNTYLDDNVTIGYPIRSKLKNSIRTKTNLSLDTLLDELSEGSFIGEECIIRRSSTIYERVNIGKGVELGHNVIVREDTIIEDHSKIGTGTIIDGGVHIGSGTTIQSNVYIPPRVEVGARVFIAPRVTFTNDRYPPSRKIVKIVVEDDAIIGANSTIIAGIIIGKGAVIAAGSVVTRSVEPYTVVAGIPAKPIMSRDEYEKRKQIYELETRFPLK
ncbi:MAG: N-acetyltransferase [Ignisphaera sp.]|nr:N-acetyltransferase [Ignisphaera sp.]MCX8168161.1 N-acetyltransferase [Ignisphaera sp.]MDW8085199.1 DapH/DapD/GlmU-related protein [Ignisphaera sp.]